MPLSTIPTATVRWALLENQFPEDIAHLARECLHTFQSDPSSYDCPELSGPRKQAELLLKLCYWLALGRLSLEQFREWAARIPPEDNEGWDVDLSHHAPDSVLPRELKLGPFCPLEAAASPR